MILFSRQHIFHHSSKVASRRKDLSPGVTLSVAKVQEEERSGLPPFPQFYLLLIFLAWILQGLYISPIVEI